MRWKALRLSYASGSRRLRLVESSCSRGRARKVRASSRTSAKVVRPRRSRMTSRRSRCSAVERSVLCSTAHNEDYTSCTRLLAESCSTRRASPMRSTIRRSASPRPMMTSGSGAATSVHWGGTEQIVLSSMRSRSRLPDRLWRSPTQTSCRSANGWKGWVTRTRCAEATVGSAFAGELQATRARAVSLALGGRWRGDDLGCAALLSPVRHRLANAAENLVSHGGRMTCGRLTQGAVGEGFFLSNMLKSRA